MAELPEVQRALEKRRLNFREGEQEKVKIFLV